MRNNPVVDAVSPAELKKALADGREYALLDVRERGHYAGGHLLAAINLPLSRLELCMRRFVPRHGTRVLLCDAGGGHAQKAAAVMAAAGYVDVSVVDGGVHACTGAGFRLFRNHYALPYAFGLYVSQRYRLPEIAPGQLAAALGSSRPPVVIDSRTAEEYREASVPGAINLPLGELSYRIRSAVPDPAVPVVVTCGAVTRGILGGAALVEMEIPNPVSILTSGVRGWEDAGYATEPGQLWELPRVSDDAASCAMKAARRIGAATGVRRISYDELDQWRTDRTRTLFIVDIRTRDEYRAGHLPDAVWIPGSELMGLHEDHIGTMNARICLVDDDGVRATFVAGWLNRMGWPDVAVLADAARGQLLAAGFPGDRVPELDAIDADTLSPAELEAVIETEKAVLIDFADSISFEKAHIAGACWASRTQLPDWVADLRGTGRLVTTSPDGRLATLAAAEITGVTGRPVAVLRGGTGAWAASGRGLVGGLTRTLCEIDDFAAGFISRPGDGPGAVAAARRKMLEWQAGLLDSVDADETFCFPDLPRVVDDKRRGTHV